MVGAQGSPFAPETVFRRSTDVVGTEIADDELVMMSLDVANYVSASGPAAAIWRLLETDRTIDDLTTALLEQYSVELDECARETERVVRELVDAGMVEEVIEAPTSRP